MHVMSIVTSSARMGSLPSNLRRRRGAAIVSGTTGGVRIWSPVAVATSLALRRVVHPAPGGPEDADGDEQRHDEKHPGHRRAIRHVLEREELFVQVQVV